MLEYHCPCVPAVITAAMVSEAIHTHFGAVFTAGRFKPSLRTSADGRCFGTVVFCGGEQGDPTKNRAAKNRAAAVCRAIRTEWGVLSIDDKPTAGLHFTPTQGSGARDGVCDDDGSQDGSWDDCDAPCEQTAVDAEWEAVDMAVEAEWCPDEYICPITLELLEDPVIAADGLTYEREALQGWIDKHAAQAVCLSPATGAPLAHRELTPNHDILAKISAVGRLAVWLR